MNIEATVSLNRYQRQWWPFLCLFVVLAVSAFMGMASLTIAIGLAASLILGCIGLILIGLRQYALIVAGCIAIALFVDWLPLLPYPFGGPGIPIAPLIALVLLIFVLTFETALRGWEKPVGWWFWVALLVLGAPALLVSVDKQDGINYYFTFFVAPLIFFILGIVVATSVNRVVTLFRCLALLATFIGVHSIIQATTGVFLFSTPYVQSILTEYNNFIFAGTTTIRASSFLLNPDPNGGFLAVTLFIPLSLALSESSRGWRIWHSLECIIIVLALLMTYTVGAIVAGAIGLACFLFLVVRPRRILQIGLTAGIIGLVIYLAFSSQMSVLLMHASDPGESSLREAIWRTTLNMITANPITGIGLGNNTYMARELLFLDPAQRVFEPEAHNSYLELAALAGIPTALMYCALVLRTVKATLGNVLAARNQLRTLLAVAPCAAITLTLFSFEESGWTLRPLTWMVWLILGVSISPLLLRALQPAAASRPTLAALIARPTPAYPQPILALWSEAASRVNGRQAALQAGLSYMLALSSLSVEALGRRNISFPRLPAIHLPAIPSLKVGANSGIVARLVKDSGIYAIASFITPLISLVLAPFLTRNLSIEAYGDYTLINVALIVIQFITQLGLGPAIVRAYNYEFSDARQQGRVLGNAFLLINGISIPLNVLVMANATNLANALLHRPELGNVIVAGAFGLMLQNMAFPALSWLLAASKRMTYTLLTILNPAVVLSMTLFLVGHLNMGIYGAALATAAGNAVVAIIIVPIFVHRARWQLQANIARSLMVVGLPIIPSLITNWILALSDRYLLSLFAPIKEVAIYSIGYTLGWTLNNLLVSPFVSAWGTRLFEIAKMPNALKVFRQVFRLYFPLLLFAAFGLGQFGQMVLGRLFPAPYQEAAPIAVVVAVAGVFNGLYYIFHAGCQIQKKLWLIPIYFGVSSIANVILNLLLIPRMGAMGAALATLIGYALLALSAYLGNQMIFPVPFQIMRFVLAGILGMGLYLGTQWAVMQFQPMWNLPIRCAATLIYGGALLIFALWHGATKSDDVPGIVAGVKQ